MYVISSNNGPWDYDMIGAVGAVQTVDEFIPFVKKHMSEVKGDPVPGDELVVYEGDFDVALLLDKHELNLMCAGEDVMAVLTEEPDCIPAIYVLSEVD